MIDNLARRSVVSNSLAHFLNSLRFTNSESLETLDKENYQFLVAHSLTCTFEQIDNNLRLKQRNLLISSKESDLSESLTAVNQTELINVPMNSSTPHNSTCDSEPGSLVRSKFIQSCSFTSNTSNNTLDSLNSFNASDCELNGDDNLIQQSVDSGFSTLLSTNALSNGIHNDKVQKNLDCKKDEQKFISNLLYFLNFKSENETDNDRSDWLDNNLPEQIALNLVKLFSRKEPSFKIDPNELDCWLISEDDAPQKLLPIPNSVEFLTHHFNQTNLISEQDENETPSQTDQSASLSTSKDHHLSYSQSNPVDIKMYDKMNCSDKDDMNQESIDNLTNLNEKTNEDKLIDNERKKLLNNFLSTSTPVLDDQTDEMQKLNNLFHSGKFLNFSSLNNVKYRGSQIWAPPRPMIHTHIHTPPKRLELLAKQNYRCCGCGLQMDKQEASRMIYCYYTGKYFCQHGCHSKTKTIIPGYIINRWSFKLYPVSNFAFQTISNNYTKPLFNIQDLNPKLFKKVKHFQNLNDIRSQLLKLKQYILSCKKAGNLLVVYLMFEPKHFIEPNKDFVYSLEDLVSIKNDCKLLQKCCDLMHQSMNHIKHCSSCLAHGFICEICSNNQRQSGSSRSNRRVDILFPFEIGRVKQCADCFACYHLSCFNSNNSRCLKCARIEKRKSCSLKDDEIEIIETSEVY